MSIETFETEHFGFRVQQSKDFSLKINESCLELLGKYLGIRIDINENQQAKNDLIGRISSQLVNAQDRMTKEAGIIAQLEDSTISSESDIIEPVFMIVLRSLIEQIVSRRIEVKYLSDWYAEHIPGQRFREEG